MKNNNSWYFEVINNDGVEIVSGYIHDVKKEETAKRRVMKKLPAVGEIKAIFIKAA